MAFASSITADLYALAQTFGEAEAISLEAVSGLALGKGRFFAGLGSGKDCRTATALRVLRWFDIMWPAETPWPAHILRPSGKSAVALPKPSSEELAGIAHLPIWPSSRRPAWWHDLEVREFLTQSRRQMSCLRAAKIGAQKFGDRCPRKSAIHEYWQRLDRITPPSPEVA